MSRGVPSLVLVALSSADEGVDAAALSFLVQQAVFAQEKEKEAKAKREKECQDARRAAEYLNSLTSEEKEKRGKRRSSLRLLRTPLMVPDEYDSFVAPVVDSGSGMRLAVFPLVVVRPEMLGILAGLVQKDSYAFFSWQRPVHGWFCW